jgi:pilus assembly protein CpaF
MFSESLRAFLKPVTPYLDDPEVSEILINGPEEVWIEKKGRLSRTDARFSEEGLLAAARNMAQYVGRPLTEERPRHDARLPDGSRIHVVLPPVARRGTTVSIRKFFPERLKVSQLVQFGSLTPDLAKLLSALIGLRVNVVVAGGTGSGKTSLLNVLSSMIEPHERILTIEDSAELQLQQPHLVSFESRPADRLGKGEVNIGDLLHSALRLRPDRIIVGEVRGGEAFFLLQAMNTGHGGSLTTAHANTPVDTLRRLESLCLLAGFELPLRAVRAQVASAVHVVVCCERMGDGTRKVTSVAEVLPLDEKGEYRAQELYVFSPTGRGPKGEVLGHHTPTGVLPTFFGKLQAAGLGLDASFFDPAAQGLEPPPVFLADLGPATRWVRGAPPAARPTSSESATDPGAHGPAQPAAAAPAAARPAQSVPVQMAPVAAIYHAATAPLLPSMGAFDPPLAAGPPPHAAGLQPLAALLPPVRPLPAPAALAPLSATPSAAGLPALPGAPPPGPFSPGPGQVAGSAAAPPPSPTTLPSLPSFGAEASTPVPFGPSKVRAPGAVRTTTLPGPPPRRPTSTPHAPQQAAPPPVVTPAPPPRPAPQSSGSSIELDPELQAEVEASLPYESTLITRNPLLEQRPSAPARDRDEESTNPGARHPRR